MSLNTLQKRFGMLLLFIVSICNIANADNSSEAYKLMMKGERMFGEQRYLEAFDYYTAAMKAKGSNKNARLTEICLGNIANIFDYFEDYERANFYYQKCFDKAKENKDSDLMASCIINLVTTYSLMNRPDRAKEYFLLQNKMPLKNSGMRKYFFFQSQAAIAAAEDEYPIAISLHRRSLEITRQNNMSSLYVASVYNEMGRCFLKSNKPDSAITYLKRNCELCKKTELNKFLMDAYKMLATAYEDKGDKENKLEYQNLYLALSDSIFDVNQFNIVKDNLYRYEDNVNTNHIHSLNTTINRAFAVITVIAIFLLVLAVLFYIIFRQNKRLRSAYSLLFEKNKELINSREESQHLRRRYVETLDRDSNKKDTKENAESDADDFKNMSEQEIRDDYNSIQNTRLLNDINAVMENIDCISDPEFSISTLASAVGSNVKYVSAIINDTYKMNFKSYLNEFRIREASKRLADNDVYGNMTIKAISEGVGYNSVNNFIIAFKRIVGITPSAYQKMAMMKDENTFND